MSIVRKAYDGLIAFWRSPLRLVLSGATWLIFALLHTGVDLRHLFGFNLTFTGSVLGPQSIPQHGTFASLITAVAILMGLVEMHKLLSELFSSHLEEATQKIMKVAFWGALTAEAIAEAAHGNSELLYFTVYFYMILEIHRLKKIIKDRRQ